MLDIDVTAIKSRPLRRIALIAATPVIMAILFIGWPLRAAGEEMADNLRLVRKCFADEFMEAWA